MKTHPKVPIFAGASGVHDASHLCQRPGFIITGGRHLLRKPAKMTICAPHFLRISDIVGKAVLKSPRQIFATGRILPVKGEVYRTGGGDEAALARGKSS